jgi:hypothetical protein
MGKEDFTVVLVILILTMLASCENCDNTDHIKQSMWHIEKMMEQKDGNHNNAAGVRDPGP